jgi:glycosyltransferase
MKISVVTVCRNSEATLRNALESFLSQTYRDKSLLVVDGASTDSTLNIARSYRSPEITVISEPDRGIYDAMNRGLRLFDGDAVGFLNSDDAFHDTGALSSIAAGLQDADIVYGDQTLVADHDSKRLIRMWRAGEFRRDVSFRMGWVPPHPTFYARRSVVEKIGEFDLRYSIASDYDFMLRAMAVEDFRVKYIPKTLIDYKLGGTSSKGLRNIVRGNLECLDSRRRHLRSGLIDLALFLRVLRRLAQFRIGMPKSTSSAYPGRD